MDRLEKTFFQPNLYVSFEVWNFEGFCISFLQTTDDGSFVVILKVLRNNNNNKRKKAVK